MSWLHKVFFGNNAKRLRSGWRLAFFFLLLTAIGMLSSRTLAVPLRHLLGDGLLAGQVLRLLNVTLAVWLACRWLDRRPFSSLGLRPTWSALRDLLVGIGMTFVMMGLIFLIERQAGWLRVLGFAWQRGNPAAVWRQAGITFLLFILVGWNEELVTRGYLLQTLADGLNLKWAVLVSSAIFGLAHLGNPNATWVSAAGIFLAGIFLAYGYVRTGQLWLSIGLHIGWNYFEGVVFGFPVSGLNLPRLTLVFVKGPVLWTGGAFGPEAGLVVVPALALGMALIYLYTRHHTPHFAFEDATP